MAGTDDRTTCIPDVPRYPNSRCSCGLRPTHPQPADCDDRGTPRIFPGFGRRTLGNSFLVFFLLFVGLGGIAPDWMTMVLGNLLGFVGAILFLEGIRKFRGLKPYVWGAYAGAALETMVLVYFH